MSRTVSQTINLQTPDQALKYITVIDQNGIKVHAEENTALNYIQITSSGMEIFKTDGAASNPSAISVANFGEIVRIGRNNETHLEMDYHSMQMIDKEGNSYFHVSDLRNTSGKTTVKEQFLGDGVTTTFQTNFTIDSISLVIINGVSTTDYTWTSRNITFVNAPSDGDIIKIQYVSTDVNLKAYTLGSRKPNSSIGGRSLAEGRETTASGHYSHAEGIYTEATGYSSHTEGQNTEASSNFCHAEGNHTIASGPESHAEGSYTTASGIWSHAEGNHTIASGSISHAEGYHTTAGSDSSHAEGDTTTASGKYSHTEGYHTTANNDSSHAEGDTTTASGKYSHAEGYHTTANGNSSHAEGDTTTASGIWSHAEGNCTIASGSVSHAEGDTTTASDYSAHAEGFHTTASGKYSHAEGGYTAASGDYSHAQNYRTVAASKRQTAIGQYNEEDTNDLYAFIIGNGSADNARTNALTVDWNGSITIGKLGGIFYKGSQSTYRMIRFIDNTDDTYGNGISIGGGGLAVLGSGESANTILSNLNLTSSGGTETTYIGSDSNIIFYPSINTWDASAAITMSAGRIWAGVNGNTTRENQVGVQSGAGQIYMYAVASATGNRGIYVPAHGTGSAKTALLVDTNNNITFTGNLTGNVTGNCTGSSGSCTGNAATATKATKDGSDNVITSTYLKLSGGTVTGDLTLDTATLKLSAGYWITWGDRNVACMNTKGEYFFGFDGYTNKRGTTYFDGNTVSIRSNTSVSINQSTSITGSLTLSGSVLGKSSRNLINNATSNQCRVGNASDNLYLYGLTSGTSGSTLKTSGNRIYYDSSSKRYKHNIENLSDRSLDPKKLYDLNVRQFIFNDDFLTEADERYHKLVVGLIAEEVYEKYPIAANLYNGQPEDWNERYIIPPMLALIQEQKKEIDELRARIEELEK